MVLYLTKGAYMLVFIKKDYDKQYRRQFIEQCFEKYQKFAGARVQSAPSEAKGKNDKPYFEDYPNVRFSLSHSDNYAVLAMGETEIGCDIEKIRDINFRAIANRWFSDGEIEATQTLDDYFSIWTKKEAVLKYTADGLSGIKKFDVTEPIEYEGQKIVLTPIDFLEGYKGAIASTEQEILFTDAD